MGRSVYSRRPYGTPYEGYGEYLASAEWRKRRDRAIARAEGRCQLCNSEKYLNVHHRSYARLGHEKAADLVVLCRACHEHFHGIDDGHARSLSVVPKERPERSRKAVLKALNAGGGRMRTLKELRAMTGLTKSQVKAALVALAAAKQTIEPKQGYWQLRKAVMR